MTKEEFIDAYCKRSNVSWESLSQWRVPLPCACGEDECDGWAMVINKPEMIEDHMELYAPVATAAKETP